MTQGTGDSGKVGARTPGEAISQSQELRVFVSSTFVDYFAERELLVRTEFPHIAELCSARGVSFVEVDLRTGVTEEQSGNNQVIKLCMGEVTRCQYFVSMLGVRYGWSQNTKAQFDAFKVGDTSSWDGRAGEYVPNTWGQDAVLAKTFATGAEAHPHFRDIIETYNDRSITEIEIRTAVLNCRPEDRVGRRFWFHLREEGFIPSNLVHGKEVERDERDTSKFLSEDDVKGAKVRALRSQMLALSSRPTAEGGCGRGEEMVVYKEPAEVAKRIGLDLLAAVEEDLPGARRSLWEQEDWDQHDASRVLLRTFYRSRQYDALEMTLLQNPQRNTHAIIGPEGSGKSSFCASLGRTATRWVKGGSETPGDRLEKAHSAPDGVNLEFVHTHMAGCSRYGGKPVFVTRRLMQFFKRHFSLDLEIPSKPIEALNQLDVFLRLVGSLLTKSGKVGLIILDGIDKLDGGAGGSAALPWLKWKMPDNIHLVLSFAQIDKTRQVMGIVDTASTHALGLAPVPVPQLTSDESMHLVGHYLERYSKRLSPEQKLNLIQALNDNSREESAAFAGQARAFFGTGESFETQSANHLVRYLTVLSEEIRKLGTFETLARDTLVLVEKPTSVALISFVLEKAANALDEEYGGRKGVQEVLDQPAVKTQVDKAGGELFKAMATLIAESSQGLEAQGLGCELGKCLQIYRDMLPPSLLDIVWDPMEQEQALFVLRPFLRRVGAVPALLATEHEEVTRAILTPPIVGQIEPGAATGSIETPPLGDLARRGRVLRALEALFSANLDDPHASVMARQVQELPGIYVKLNKHEDLRRFLGRLDVFLTLYNDEDKAELLRFPSAPPESFVQEENGVTTSVYDDDLRKRYETGLQEALAPAGERPEKFSLSNTMAARKNVFMKKKVDKTASLREALHNYAKVGEFLMLDAAQYSAAHEVLKDGLAKCQEAMAKGAGGCELLHVLLSRKITVLYGRYRYAADTPEHAAELLLSARNTLENVNEEDRDHNFQLLTAGILEGLGYVYLFPPKPKNPDFVLPGDNSAANLFRQEIAVLTKMPDWETASPALLDAHWKALARIEGADGSESGLVSVCLSATPLCDAFNALGSALEAELKQVLKTGDQEVSDHPNLFKDGELAYQLSIRTGKELLSSSDENVGRSHLSLGTLYMLAGRNDDAARELKGCMPTYLKGLGADHPRVAWPHHRLGEVFWLQAKEMEEADKEGGMAKLLEAQKEAQRAFDIRVKAFPPEANFGGHFRDASQKLLQDISAYIEARAGV